MQLTPRELFTIARGLEDGSDTTQYYVRAVVKDGTGTVIDTVNLTDQGDHHLYLKQWQVPADTSGQGNWIIITTSVYTDSGFTTKSANYGDSYDTYLVMDRYNTHLGGYSGVGGTDIDYKKVRQIIKEELGALPKEKPEPKEPDLSPVLDGIKTIQTKVEKAIAAIQIPEPKEIDLSLALAKIHKAISTAENKKITDEQIQPLRDICDEWRNMMNEKGELMEGVTTTAQDALECIQNFFTTDVEKIMAGIDQIKKMFANVTHMVVQNKKEELPQEEANETPAEEDAEPNL